MTPTTLPGCQYRRLPRGLRGPYTSSWDPDYHSYLSGSSRTTDESVCTHWSPLHPVHRVRPQGPSRVRSRPGPPLTATAGVTSWEVAPSVKRLCPSRTPDPRPVDTTLDTSGVDTKTGTLGDIRPQRHSPGGVGDPTKSHPRSHAERVDSSPVRHPRNPTGGGAPLPNTPRLRTSRRTRPAQDPTPVPCPRTRKPSLLPRGLNPLGPRLG